MSYRTSWKPGDPQGGRRGGARRRRARPSFLRAMAQPLFGLFLFGLLWVGIKLDLHAAIARAIMAPLVQQYQR